MPVRTFLGYPLIQVLEKRESMCEVKVAHILLMNDRENPTNNLAIKVRTDSIYKLIQAGQDFGELAEKYSQDPGTASQKGELPWFGSGQMIPEFEKASFSLNEKGEVSKPIMSQFGWHIIRLIDKKPLETYDEMKTKLTNEIKQNERNQKVNEAFIDDLKKQYNFSVNNSALADFYKITDKYAPGDSLFNVEAEKLNAPLATFANQTISQKELSNQLASSSGFRGVRVDFINNSFKNLVSEKLKAYEMTQLPGKYPDYRNLLNEYHDGILLFEVMNNEVWDKATKDTEGLSKYFNENKSNYSWDKPRYKGRVVHVKDKASLKAAKNIIKRADKDSIDKYLTQRLNDSIQYVKIEKGLWAEGENAVIDAKIFKKAKYEPTEDYPYYIVDGKKIGTTPEDYSDVRGAVTSDYQDYLEKSWIAHLRNKYPVTINEDVLKMVKQN